MTDALDRFVALEFGREFGRSGATPARDGDDCGCARCRTAWPQVGWDEAPNPRGAPGATRAGTGGAAMPRWGGWSAPVSLQALRDAWADRRRQPISGALSAFFRTGTPNIYRISRSGIDRARPLTIGMTELNNSIFGRVHQHKCRADGDPSVKAKIQSLDDARILVQAGRVSGRPDIRQAHGYEIWLQGRERPLIYEPDSRTFDESHW